MDVVLCVQSVDDCESEVEWEPNILNWAEIWLFAPLSGQHASGTGARIAAGRWMPS